MIHAWKLPYDHLDKYFDVEYNNSKTSINSWMAHSDVIWELRHHPFEVKY